MSGNLQITAEQDHLKTTWYDRVYILSISKSEMDGSLLMKCHFKYWNENDGRSSSRLTPSEEFSLPKVGVGQYSGLEVVPIQQ